MSSLIFSILHQSSMNQSSDTNIRFIVALTLKLLNKYKNVNEALAWVRHNVDDCKWCEKALIEVIHRIKSKTLMSLQLISQRSGLRWDTDVLESQFLTLSQDWLDRLHRARHMLQTPPKDTKGSKLWERSARFCKVPYAQVGIIWSHSSWWPQSHSRRGLQGYVSYIVSWRY